MPTITARAAETLQIASADQSGLDPIAGTIHVGVDVEGQTWWVSEKTSDERVEAGRCHDPGAGPAVCEFVSLMSSCRPGPACAYARAHA